MEYFNSIDDSSYGMEDDYSDFTELTISGDPTYSGGMVHRAVAAVFRQRPETLLPTHFALKENSGDRAKPSIDVYPPIRSNTTANVATEVMYNQYVVSNMYEPIQVTAKMLLQLALIRIEQALANMKFLVSLQLHGLNAWQIALTNGYCTCGVFLSLHGTVGVADSCTLSFRLVDGDDSLLEDLINQICHALNIVSPVGHYGSDSMDCMDETVNLQFFGSGRNVEILDRLVNSIEHHSVEDVRQSVNQVTNLFQDKNMHDLLYQRRVTYAIAQLLISFYNPSNAQCGRDSCVELSAFVAIHYLVHSCHHDETIQMLMKMDGFLPSLHAMIRQNPIYRNKGNQIEALLKPIYACNPPVAPLVAHPSTKAPGVKA